MFDFTPMRVAIPIFKKDAEFGYKNYFDAMIRMGAEPSCAAADCSVTDYDGLLLPGGHDIDPARYGEVDERCLGVDPELDTLQFAALDRFVKAGKPVFGICRGHQLINVYFGGKLIQHLSTTPNHYKGAGEKDLVNLCVSEDDSILYNLYGKEFPVNSNHHQAIKTLGDGLRVTLISKNDNVIEGCEVPGTPIFSVQFHPERMCFLHARPDTVNGSKLLQVFLDRCRECRS